MKNTVGKGIFFYILIFLAVVVGVLCIFMSILVFSPGTSLFGIAYFSNNSEKTVNEYTIDGKDGSFSITDAMQNDTIKKIRIETNYYSVKIASTDSIKYSFLIEGSTSGLYKSSEEETNNNKILYSAVFDEETKCLTFSVREPNAMFFFTKTGYITMNVPPKHLSYMLNKDLEIVTSSGNITITEHEDDEARVRNFTADHGSGSLYMGKNFVVFYNTNITSTSGNLKSYANLQGPTKIVTKSGKLELTQTEDIQIISETSLINLGTVDGDVKYYSNNGGLLNAEIINGDLECEEDTKVSNINIGVVKGQTILPCAENTNIRIKQTVGKCYIKTDSGEVILDDIKAGCDVITKNGSVKYIVNHTNANEKVNVTTESGKIEARYKNVLGQSTIKTTKGEILVKYVPSTSCIFDLIYTCKQAPTVTDGISTNQVEPTGTFHIGHGGTNTVSQTIEVNSTEGKVSFDDTMKDSFKFA